MTVGAIIEGKISSIKPFGLFVTFENTFGFCHISELSKGYVSNINDMFVVSQEVKAKIISIDEKGKINLSIKQLENNSETKVEQVAPIKKIYNDRPPKQFNKNKRKDILQEDPNSFEGMMKSFMKASEEKINSTNRRTKKHTKR